MPSKSRFTIAESSITSFFNQHPQQVFSREHLSSIFEEQKNAWDLPDTSTDLRFIRQLQKKGILTKIEIQFDGYLNNKERYITEDANVFEIAVSLTSRSYLSHLPAMFLNGLIKQMPQELYITFEQSKKNISERQLKQEAIDAAFSKAQRRTGAEAILGEFSLIVLNGMFTDGMGIHFIENLPVTNLERTLIDITVRPSYAGGVYIVLEAYESALPNVSLNKLIDMLDEMNFIYPYHQAVGFYLERAGYHGKELEELRNRRKEHKFYLTYEMENKDFSEDWQIYFPNGM